MSYDPLFVRMNQGEAALWVLIGCGFAIRAAASLGIRALPLADLSKLQRKRCWQATLVFVLFGISDLVETQTGAWWRPWWLLAWKAACVSALAILLMEYLRSRRR